MTWLELKSKFEDRAVDAVVRRVLRAVRLEDRLRAVAGRGEKGDVTGPALTVALGKLLITLAHDTYLLRNREIEVREYRHRLSGNVGSSAGIVAGAAAGMACGSFLPGLGNVIGAFAGAVVGSMGGEHLGRTISDWLEDKPGEGTEETSDQRSGDVKVGTHSKKSM